MIKAAGDKRHDSRMAGGKQLHSRDAADHIYWERADRGYENEAFGPTSTDRFDDARRRIDSPGV
jgi:hypothetical protein